MNSTVKEALYMPLENECVACAIRFLINPDLLYWVLINSNISMRTCTKLEIFKINC